jgi:hypothetical protein
MSGDICFHFFVHFRNAPFKNVSTTLHRDIGKNQTMIGIANAFSAGIFLSISLLHLLPEVTLILKTVSKYF